MKKQLILAALVLMVTATFFYSCSKSSNNNNTSGGTARVSMHLTDDPGDYDHVYLDIQQVVVTMSGGSAVTLNPVRAGIYDLLSFRNGMDTLLVRADLPAGTIEQIRLVLGANSSIVVDGTSYPLNTPSAQESGVKLNINQTFTAGGAYDVWIDFDAGKSIVLTGSGTYKLKPVIRAYSSLTMGRIKGYVLPLSALATVYAINGTDTFSAIPAAVDGFFMLNGLAAGTYQVRVQPALLTLQTYVQTDVVVTYGVDVNLGTITLHP